MGGGWAETVHLPQRYQLQCRTFERLGIIDVHVHVCCYTMTSDEVLTPYALPSVCCQPYSATTTLCPEPLLTSPAWYAVLQASLEAEREAAMNALQALQASRSRTPSPPISRPMSATKRPLSATPSRPQSGRPPAAPSTGVWLMYSLCCEWRL